MNELNIVKSKIKEERSYDCISTIYLLNFVFSNFTFQNEKKIDVENSDRQSKYNQQSLDNSVGENRANFLYTSCLFKFQFSIQKILIRCSMGVKVISEKQSKTNEIRFFAFCKSKHECFHIFLYFFFSL